MSSAAQPLVAKQRERHDGPSRELIDLVGRILATAAKKVNTGDAEPPIESRRSSSARRFHVTVARNDDS